MNIKSTQSGIMWVLIVGSVLAVIMPTPYQRAFGQEQVDKEAINAAVYLMQTAMTPDRRGRFITLLMALRQLEDPALAPFYQRLTESDNALLRIHGLLGLAESSKTKTLDMNLLSEFSDPALQAKILGVALDNNLLTHDQAKQIVRWKTIDPGAKLVLIMRLVGAKEFDDVKVIKQIANTETLGRKAIAGLLLLQLGDPAGAKILADLDASVDQNRSAIRSVVLKTANSYDYDKIGPWAFSLSKEKDTNKNLRQSALRIAVRFNVSGALTAWQREFKETKDLAQQYRQALAMLSIAQWTAPEAFDTISASEDKIIASIGVAGKAVASKSNDIPKAIDQLIQQHYALANKWAIFYAERHASPQDAMSIFTSIIKAYDTSPKQTKTRRLDEAMQAAQYMYKKDPSGSKLFLEQILANPQTKAGLIQGILVGLIQTNRTTPHEAVASITQPFDDDKSNRMKILLQAKNGVKLSVPQIKELSLMARGGGGLPASLRMQASWSYVKVTSQTNEVIRQLLR